jgi:quercetin dioxygenase-like cupin family protein
MKDITTTAIIKRDNLKVIRLEIKAGAILSDHASKTHVLIVCVKGKGRFNINQTAHPLSVGIVLEVEPNTMHSVNADTDLEIIVLQMTLHLNEHSRND